MELTIKQYNKTESPHSKLKRESRNIMSSSSKQIIWKIILPN